MRENNPLKPGTPAFSPAVRNKMLKVLPILSVLVSVSIVAGQYSRKARLEADLIETDKLEKTLEARYKQLTGGKASAPSAEAHEDHHD